MGDSDGHRSQLHGMPLLPGSKAPHASSAVPDDALLGLPSRSTKRVRLFQNRWLGQSTRTACNKFYNGVYLTAEVMGERTFTYKTLRLAARKHLPRHAIKAGSTASRDR